MAELNPLHAPHFAATKLAEEICKRLRADEALIDAQKPCSWVAWHLPEYRSESGEAIATCLTPYPGLGHDVKKLVYDNILGMIRRYLKDGGPNAAHNAAVGKMDDVEKELLPEELSTALKVLVRLQETGSIQHDTTAESITAWLQKRVLSDPEESTSIPKPPPIYRKRLCYICRLEITNPFPSQPSMCIPCGSFNHASSQISTPLRLTLPHNFTALVTGARVNLGYHTVLRLLRYGARVIATTRYPRDAISRYIEEPDSFKWKDRLRAVGADFRSARDAHELVRETKQCLKQWADGGKARLYALINNAAQTLTDSVRKEERATEQEEDLKRRITHQGFLIEGRYTARVRGGALPLGIENARNGSASIATPENDEETTGALKQIDTSGSASM